MPFVGRAGKSREVRIQSRQEFNLFYHRHRIIAEPDEMKKAVLIAAADIARRQLTAALLILGISVPERM